jgi:hypothetical protein
VPFGAPSSEDPLFAGPLSGRVCVVFGSRRRLINDNCLCQYFSARIDRLERSTRHWRRISFCAFCILGALFLLGAQSRQTTVEAQRFVLVDADGKPRASFHTDAKGPNLGMLDARGNPRAILTVAEEGPRLNLYDSAVRACIELGVYSDFPLLHFSTIENLVLRQPRCPTVPCWPFLIQMEHQELLSRPQTVAMALYSVVRLARCELYFPRQTRSAYQFWTKQEKSCSRFPTNWNVESNHEDFPVRFSHLGLIVEDDEGRMRAVETLAFDANVRKRLEASCQHAHATRYNFASMMDGFEASLRALLAR